MTTNPFDFVKSVSSSKVHMLDEDPQMEQDYDAFMVNRALSYFPDCIMHVNEVNQINNVVDKRLLYDYLFYALRSRNRYAGSWGKKKKIENLDIIKEFFLYSNQKALDALSILTDEQIELIRQTRETGGSKSCNE